jgi:hypothetical protein
MKKKHVLLLLCFLLVAAAGTLLYLSVSGETPEPEINRARKLLAEAERVEAPRYAPDQYRDAAAYYDSAMSAWSRENERLIFFRDYSGIAEYATRSSELSNRAIGRSRNAKSRVGDILEARIGELGREISRFEVDFGNFPMESRHREELTRCKLRYEEGLILFGRQDYPSCREKLDSVEKSIENLSAFYEERLKTYLVRYPVWSEQVEQAMAQSRRRKTYALVVDKLARELRVVKDGKNRYTFAVELGMNWIGDKQQKGDKSTPEGMYRVIDKKMNGETKYYKALLLDYPNEDDRTRFSQNKKNGVLRPDVEIGSHIEIHGSGGKGTDWTDGCIALKDEDMNIVFNLCPVGTEVVIVGSTRPFHEVSR